MTDQREREHSDQGQPSRQHAGSTPDHGDLAERLSALARELEQENDTEGTLTLIVQNAIGLVPGAEEGSISVVVGRRHVDSRVPSSPLAAQVDQLQAETGQGPCLRAVYEQTVRVDDMRSEERWPAFAERAYEAGVASMLSFQLYVDDDSLGALNLYARTTDAFDDESEHIGLLFAAHAAVAFSGVRKQEQLAAGMATRDLIGQAKGRLMERFGLDSDQAFMVLTRASREANRKLRDVAEEVALGGQLAGRPGQGLRQPTGE